MAVIWIAFRNQILQPLQLPSGIRGQHHQVITGAQGLLELSHLGVFTLPTAVLLAVAAALIGVQIAGSTGWDRALDRNLAVRVATGAPSPTFSLRGDAVAAWLERNAAPDESVVVSEIARQHGAFARQATARQG